MFRRSARNLAAAFLVAFAPTPAFAGTVFSEIMYDLPGADQGREWIEVMNAGDAPVDLGGARLVEGGVKHKLKALGSSILLPGAYAIIADDTSLFHADQPEFSGLIFESTFSLGNAGETLALVDASSTPLASAAYSSADGAAGDGNTLNALSGRWTSRAPSPGAPAATAAIPPPAPPTQKAQKSTGNLAATPPVRTVRAPAQGAEVASVQAAVQAAESPERAVPPSLFAILPWIGGLLLVSAGGIAAVLMGRPKNRSGYEIIEEKS